MNKILKMLTKAITVTQITKKQFSKMSENLTVRL